MSSIILADPIFATDDVESEWIERFERIGGGIDLSRRITPLRRRRLDSLAEVDQVFEKLVRFRRVPKSHSQMQSNGLCATDASRT